MGRAGVSSVNPTSSSSSARAGLRYTKEVVRKKLF